jgi:succinoglycan biosynthesis transport protein ExoP
VITARLALKTASQLNRPGKQTMIVDWNLEGAGIARQLNLPKAPGLIELIQGGARFAEVVRRVPGTQVHFIASGHAIAEGPIGLDADQLNLILDALDEAYDHIVVVGQAKSASILFEAIQGRFDAGVIVSEPGYELSDPQGTFLGFEVADIDLVRFEYTRIQPENAA